MSEQAMDDLDLGERRDVAHDRYLLALQRGEDAAAKLSAWEAYVEAAAAHDMARDPSLRGDGQEERR